MTKDQQRAIARRVGLRVRTGRAFKGWTAAALAERVALPQWRLGQIEAGLGPGVSADDLVAIARALELPVWFFFEVPLEDAPLPACPVCGRRWPG